MPFLPNRADTPYSGLAELDSNDIEILRQGFAGYGIVSGAVVSAQGTPDGTVAVAAGTIRSGGSNKTVNAGNVSVLTGSANPDGSTALAADANFPRYDLITANVGSGGVSQLGVLHGTPASVNTNGDAVISADFPNFTAKVILAVIFVPKAATTVTTTMLNEKRLVLDINALHDAVHVMSGGNHTGAISIAQGLGKPQALTGATQATNYVGATSSGAPTTGTFAIGDWVVDRTGRMWICTTAGTPGTWTQVGGVGVVADTIWDNLGDIAYGTAADAAAVLPLGKRGQIIKASSAQGAGDSTTADSLVWGHPLTPSPYGTRIADEFFYSTGNFTTSGAPIGALGISLAGTGAQGTVGNLTAVANHPGILGLSTGTTTTGRAGVNSGQTSILLGGGRARWGAWVHIPTLSVVAQRFEVLCGFSDNFSSATAVDGCFLHYRDDINSGKWEAITIANSVSTATVTDTGITVAAATWYYLEADVAADGSSVTYYINGTAVVTHSANVPVGTGRECGFYINILKSLGTTAELLNVDAYYVDLGFTTTR